jgi:RND family efflux transporter MFP subunit
MRQRHAVFIGIGTALVLVLGFTLLWLVRREPRVEVTTTAVTSGTVARQILATSSLEPSRSVDVGSEVSGTIESVNVDFNSKVRAGQIIARIDPSTYQSQLEAARAALAQARADASRMNTMLSDARTKFNRAKELAADDLIPTSELDDARVTMDQAAADLHKSQADIQAAQAQMDQATVNLSRTVIRSPIDGIVVNRNVNVGQTLTVRLESPVLFTIADLRRMKLLVEIDEAEAGGVRPGTPVSFEVESLGPQKFEGRIAEVRLQPYAEQAAVATTGTTSPATTATSGSSRSSISTSSSGTAARASSGSSPAVQSPATQAASTVSTGAPSGPAAPGVVTYTAVVDVNNEGGGLAPGGTAIVTVSGAERNGVIRIPNNALSFRPDRKVLDEIGQPDPPLDAVGPSGVEKASRRGRVAHVWRYENGRFAPVTVEIGIADDEWTELVNGPIQAGDQLVTRAVVTK